jgi:hypothetical protein
MLKYPSRQILVSIADRLFALSWESSRLLFVSFCIVDDCREAVGAGAAARSSRSSRGGIPGAPAWPFAASKSAPSAHPHACPRDRPSAVLQPVRFSGEVARASIRVLSANRRTSSDRFAPVRAAGRHCIRAATWRTPPCRGRQRSPRIFALGLALGGRYDCVRATHARGFAPTDRRGSEGVAAEREPGQSIGRYSSIVTPCQKPTWSLMRAAAGLGSG